MKYKTIFLVFYLKISCFYFLNFTDFIPHVLCCSSLDNFKKLKTTLVLNVQSFVMNQMISAVASLLLTIFLIKMKANYVCYAFKFYQGVRNHIHLCRPHALFWRKSNNVVYLLISLVCYGLGNQPWNCILYERVMASRRPVETFVLARIRKLITE